MESIIGSSSRKIATGCHICSNLFKKNAVKKKCPCDLYCQKKCSGNCTHMYSFVWYDIHMYSICNMIFYVFICICIVYDMRYDMIRYFAFLYLYVCNMMFYVFLSTELNKCNFNLKDSYNIYER